MDFLACASSFLGPNKSIKFLVDDDQTEIACCIAQYLSNLPYQDSMSQFINSAVQSFHEKHHEGTSTLFAFIYLFYKCIKTAVDNGQDLFSVCDSLKQTLDQCIAYLEKKSFNLLDALIKIQRESCKKIINDEVNVKKPTENLPPLAPKIALSRLNILSKSRYFKEFASVDSDVCESTDVNSKFQLNDSCLKQMEEIVKQTSHGNCELNPVLVKAWVKQIEERNVKNSHSDLTLDVKRLYILSIVGDFATSTVVSGLVIPVAQSLNIFITKNHTRNALMILGSVKHDYKHRGFNQPLKSEFVVSASEYTNLNSKGEIWIQDILDMLKNLNVDLLLVQGSVDEKLFDLCVSSGILIIEKMDPKLLSLFSMATSVPAEYYILDCDELNVVRDINLELWKLDGDNRNNNNYVKLELSIPLQTVVLCSNCLPLVAIRKHRMQHFIHRLSSSLIKSIDGGGEAEMMCCRYLSHNSNQPLICDVFHNFSRYIITNCSYGTDETKPVDPFESKIEAWKCALNVAISVASTDVTILVGDENSVWKNIHQTKYHFVGNL